MLLEENPALAAALSYFVLAFACAVAGEIIRGRWCRTPWTIGEEEL